MRDACAEHVPGRGPSRRVVLSSLGGLALAAALPGCAPDASPLYTVARWMADRGPTYLIGHRGAGDVVPEHTLASYEAALAWGARAIEISVVRSADGVLFCHHDLTLERTTTLSGEVAAHASKALAMGRVDIPRLGPRWQGDRMPEIPRLEDVLDRVGRRAVLCMEAKEDDAFPDMIATIERKGLKHSVVVKLDFSSRRLSEAKAGGYPVFRYIGNVAAATSARIAAVARELDPRTDYLVVPSNEDGRLVADDIIDTAVATGVPTWVFGAHRRSEVAHHFARGVVGAVTSSVGYVGAALPPASQTKWEDGALAPGEMTKRPESGDYGLGWREHGSVTLQMRRRQAFLTLGQLAPLPQPSGPYRVDLEVRVDVAPSDEQSNFTLAFAHGDDAYYEHRQGAMDGYHALLRMTGGLELWSHRAGLVSGTLLGRSAEVQRPMTGAWIPLRLEVTPSALTWSRRDTGATVVARDSAFRGDYMHVGRSAVDGEVSIRNLRIS